jgi:hypothetical protein
MWALVASLLIFRRKRTDRSITYAALTIAIAMTLNVDAIYSAVDPLLGGTNIATLIADALLMTGLFFLGRGVMKTGEYRPRLVRAAVSIPVLLVALLAITASFLFIDRGTTTTRVHERPRRTARGGGLLDHQLHLLRHRHRRDADLAARQYRHSTGIQRLPAGAAEPGIGVRRRLCLAVIVMDIAHVTGHLDLMHAVQPPTIRSRSSPSCSSAPASRSSPPSAAPSTTPGEAHRRPHRAVGAALAPGDPCGPG